MGEDATDYFVGTRGGLRKSVLFDEKEHRVVKPRLGDRKDRVVKYGGSIVRAKAAAGEIPPSKLTEWLEARLTRDDDRQLFGLAKKFTLTPPTAAADTKNQKIAANTGPGGVITPRA